MPLFDYRCHQCGHEQEHLLPRSPMLDHHCPRCGIREGVPEGGYNRVPSAPAFHLKGSGWYKAGASR